MIKLHEKHVLLRPDTYVGDIEPTEETMWVYQQQDKKIEKEKLPLSRDF